MVKKTGNAGSPEGAVIWPAPNPNMKPDPRSWAWIERMPPPYVEPKGKKL